MVTHDPVRRMAEEDHLESQYEEIAFEAFDFDVTRNRMPFDPHSNDGRRLLRSLPHDTVLIDENGRAAQVYFEQEDDDFENLHYVYYVGTDVFVNLLHEVPEGSSFTVVYIPDKTPDVCVGGWTTCELCGHAREKGLS